MNIIDSFEAHSDLDFNLTNFSSQWCEMENVQNEMGKFRVLFSFEFLIAFASVIINFIFLLIIRKVKVMPINVRYLLAHLSFNLIWFAIATMYKTITFLAISDPCSLSMKAFDCEIRELFFTLPGKVNLYSLLGICVERLFSTFYRRNRGDHVSTPPIMAVVFILIIWAATLFNSLHSISSIPRDRMVEVCEASLSLDPKSAVAAITVNIVLEISAMCVMIAVSCYEHYVQKNIAINRVRYTLSSRFLITQNVEVNALMLPSTLLHVFCFLPTLIFFVLVIYGTPMKMSTKWLFIHLTYLWRLFYGLCHPILAFARNFHVKKQMKKSRLFVFVASMWKRSNRKVAVVYNNDLIMEMNIRAHFEYLEQMWASTYRQQKINEK